MAKKKTGRIAVPFLVTIFIGLIIVGGAAIFIYMKYFNKDDTPPKPKAREFNEITYNDSHTVLFILDEPDQKCSSTFVLMRSIPKYKRILFLGIPSNAIGVVDGKQLSMKSAFETGGGTLASRFAQSVFDVPVEHYMTFKSDVFKKTCDIMGCVTYPVDVDIFGMKGDGSMQNLNSEQIETYVTYSLFKGGEVERAFKSALLLSHMVNGADGKYISDGLENNFNNIMNMSDLDSNITSVNFKESKAAIKYMFENGTYMASAIQLDGTLSEEEFIPSSSFVNELKQQYFTDNKEKTTGETKADE